MNNEFIENDCNIFFNDFSEECLIVKNNNIINVIFNNNSANSNVFNSIELNGTNPNIIIKNVDIINNSITKNDILTIRLQDFIVVKISEDSSGISEIELNYNS